MIVRPMHVLQFDQRNDCQKRGNIPLKTLTGNCEQILSKMKWESLMTT